MGNDIEFRTIMEDKASKEIRNIRDLWQRFQKEGSEGVKAGLAATAAIKGFDLLQRAIAGSVDVVLDSIDAAKNLAEAQSKADKVFGSSAGEVKRWASTAAESFGISTRAALEAAGTYGNLFQAFGVGREEATKMSKSLVVLAADLAAMNNTSVDDALVALRAGLSGETEPLKRFGVALSDARMRTELMAQGVTKLGTTLTPLQKSTAAYAIIMKDTALAQGEYARTSDQLAQRQRELSAKMEDAQAKLGEKLLPAALKVTEAMIDLAESASDTVDDLAALGRGIDDLLSKFPGTEQGINDLGTALDMIGYALTHGGNTAGYFLEKIKEAEEAAKELTLQEANLRRLGSAGREGFKEARDAADELAASMDTVAEAGSNAAFDIKTSAGQIKRSILALRSDLVADAQESADAIWDPMIAKLELTAIEAERSALRQEIASGKLKGVELTNAKIRLAELDKSLAVQQSIVANYGDATAQIAAEKAAIARIKASEQWRTGSEEQKAILQGQVAEHRRNIDQIVWKSGWGGEQTKQQFIDGLKDWPRQSGAIASDVAGRVRGPLDGLNSYAWGRGLGSEYARGLRSTYGIVSEAANVIARGAAGPLKPSSPPKEGPLSDMDKWGERYDELIAGGMRRGAVRVIAAASGVAGRMAGVLGTGMAGAGTVGLPIDVLPPTGLRGIPAPPREIESGRPVVIQLIADGRVLAEVSEPHLARSLLSQPR